MQVETNIIFSIITVCLNAKEGIIKTALSLEKQTLSGFEWIVIDGGSDDGTVDFVSKHPLVSCFVTEPDSGIFDAMNKGIKQARGDYCLFLNAGDYLYEGAVLEKTSECLGADLIVGQMFVEVPENLQKKSCLRIYKEQNIETANYIYNRSLPHQATFIRKSLFERFGGYSSSFRILGDHDFFARVLSKRVSLSFVDFCISVYTLDGISTKMKGSQEVIQELEILRRRNFTWLFRLRKRISKRLNFCNI